MTDMKIATLAEQASNLRPDRLQKYVRLAISAAPWLVIVGLLWAGMFVKLESVGETLRLPVLEARDRFFGLSVNGQAIWMVGSNGKVVHSVDDGRSWARQDSGTSEHLQDIDAWDEHHLVAVGNQGVVITSSDGGQNWTQRVVPKNDVDNKLIDVLAIPGGQVWAVGAYGMLLFSGDQGTTWQQKGEEGELILNAVTRTPSGDLWLAGESGLLRHSTDNGESWIDVTSGVESSLMSIAFRDQQHGMAVGLDGVILVTEDAGQSWSRLNEVIQLLPVQPGYDGHYSRVGWVDLLSDHLFAVAWNPVSKQWIGVGNKGLWFSVNADYSAWKSERVASNDVTWHTAIAQRGKELFFSGESTGRWYAGHWKAFGSDH